MGGTRDYVGGTRAPVRAHREGRTDGLDANKGAWRLRLRTWPSDGRVKGGGGGEEAVTSSSGSSSRPRGRLSMSAAAVTAAERYQAWGPHDDLRRGHCP
jgi:hypothetical protein